MANAFGFATLNGALASFKLTTSIKAFAVLGLNKTIGSAISGNNQSAVTLLAPTEAAWASFLASNTLGVTASNLFTNTSLLRNIMQVLTTETCICRPCAQWAAAHDPCCHAPINHTAMQLYVHVNFPHKSHSPSACLYRSSLEL